METLTKNAVKKMEKTVVDIEILMRSACKKTAPLWPLENFVAVNPYMGRINKSFEETAHELSYLGAINMTLPISFYLEKIKTGIISTNDLQYILNKKFEHNIIAKNFINELHKLDEKQPTFKVLTLAELAQHSTKKDWGRLALNRISTWAASYFDNGQAVWNAADMNENLFTSWKREASVDLSPEILGLKDFRKIVASMPNDSLSAAKEALTILQISEQKAPYYLEALLLRFGGWAAHAARLDWDNELYGKKDGKLIDFLAALLCWEAAILRGLNNPIIEENWKEEINLWSEKNLKNSTNDVLKKKLILQEAFDLSSQKSIVQKINDQNSQKKEEKSKISAQAIFCIDVRSEVFRRNLEMIDQKIETLGFAGFFAFPIKFTPLGSQKSEAQCPVLLKTGPTIIETLSNENETLAAAKKRITKHQMKNIWKSFKSGAASCFSFVSPIGISYLPKLFTDSFGITQPVKNPYNIGLNKNEIKEKTVSIKTSTLDNETLGIELELQCTMAKNALRAMSLTSNFADFVLIVGHGSSSVNNPHATGLDCGACGGHTGEANAKVAAAVLNNKLVRFALRKENIDIPDQTVFLACLHDTTTDELLIYNEGDVEANLLPELEKIKKSLADAGHLSRKERSLKMNIDPHSDIDNAIISRSKDWSQVRPEWGLAGCSAFVIAPRKRTSGVNLNGKAFLHNYEWSKDQNFSILELIMTAPMIVTSWINLQYYASTVDNKNYGSGNKTLHNITAGIGVLEGLSGDLRVGLPMQSVHDGQVFQNEPLRLNVIIEAPLDAINSIIEKHEMVKNLCDNQWIHLLAMNNEGKVAFRYQGHLNWELIS